MAAGRVADDERALGAPFDFTAGFAVAHARLCDIIKKMLELDIIDESGGWHRFSFEASSIDVGRDPDVHLVLPAPNVSNEHCRLAASGGKIVLTDLGSTNGTFVNGVRVRAPVVISSDDRVSVGPYVLLLAKGA